jgi:hypothetical protein
MGGFYGRHSVADVALDVFNNNDRVVNDNADRQDKAE